MRRMIPTRMIDWVKDLEEVVKANGSNIAFGGNVEIDGNLKINGELEDVLELHWRDINGYETRLRFLILKTQFAEPDEEIYYMGLAYGLDDSTSVMICTLSYNSPEDFYIRGIATGEDVEHILVSISVINGVTTDDYTNNVILSSDTYASYIKNYTHSIVINGNSGSIAFNISNFYNIPIDSVIDLYTRLSNRKLAVFGVYGTSNTPIYYIDWKDSITNATINGTTTTLVSAIGSALTITDDVKVIW